MEEKQYLVTRIEGEYAYLRDIANLAEEELFVALYLLPLGTDIGTRLAYVFPEYRIMA